MPTQPLVYSAFPHLVAVVVVALTGAIIFQICVRLRYARKVRSAGNVHAPVLGKGSFTGNELLIGLLYTADPRP
jgi:hypothetical protein